MSTTHLPGLPLGVTPGPWRMPPSPSAVFHSPDAVSSLSCDFQLGESRKLGGQNLLLPSRGWNKAAKVGRLSSLFRNAGDVDAVKESGGVLGRIWLCLKLL